MAWPYELYGITDTVSFQLLLDLKYCRACRALRYQFTLQ